MRVVNYKSLLLVLTQIIEVNDIQYGSKQSKFPSVKIEDASRYLQDWIENTANLDLIRIFQFQSRIDDENKQSR